MAIRILEGKKINECDAPAAVLYDSCTGLALPVMFTSAEEADDFIAVVGDPRRLTDAQLVEALNDFRCNPPKSRDE